MSNVKKTTKQSNIFKSAVVLCCMATLCGLLIGAFGMYMYMKSSGYQICQTEVSLK